MGGSVSTLCGCNGSEEQSEELTGALGVKQDLFNKDLSSSSQDKDTNVSDASTACPSSDIIGKVTSKTKASVNSARSAQDSAVGLSDSDCDVPTQTLASQDLQGAAAERQKAFLARKKSRQEKKKKTTSSINDDLFQEQFLSNVPEVNADIAYRYTFFVSGSCGRKVVDAVCSSEAAACRKSAVRMSESDGVPTSPTGGAGTPASGTTGEARGGSAPSKELVAQDLRCLCPVPYPADRTSDERPKMAKLVFKLCKASQDPPECATRREAASTCLVTILVVDPNGEGENSFDVQLQGVEQAVQNMRFYSRPELSPVLAIMLCQSTKDGPVDEAWKAQLAQLESEYEELWKFGPVHLWKQNELYSTFATIASERIQQNQNDAGDDDGFEQLEECPRWGSAEADYDDSEAADSSRSGGSRNILGKFGRMVSK